MAVRSLYRYVRHRIRHIPSEGVQYLGICTRDGRGQDSDPQREETAAQDWMLKHAGMTGHQFFLRMVVTDYAQVFRD
ncbi:DUF7848 domain-containing protein [Streptomyces alfalfae]